MAIAPKDQGQLLEHNKQKLLAKFPHCPSDLLELAAHIGSINRAGEASDTDPPTIYKMARGGNTSEMIQARVAKALAVAKKKPVAVMHAGRHYGGAPPTEYPPLLAELISKRGSALAAATALGYRSVSVLSNIRTGIHDFTEELQEKTRRAIAGENFPLNHSTHPRRIGANSLGEDPDTGEMGIAIVLAQQKVVEAIYDAGEAMGGRWIFRYRIDASMWLIMCKIDDPAMLATFKSVVRLIAEKVVTP